MEWRSPSGRFWHWANIVRYLRDRPETWAIRLIDQPARLVRTVNDRSSPDLHMPDGLIQVKIVYEYTDQTGRRRGDIYLRFLPDGGKLPPD